MTRSAWILAGAAMLLGAAGCRERGSSEQGRPVAQAQQQSEQALERAQEAQEAARDQREDVGDAREEVAEARTDLQEAQQEVQQQRQEALEAQRRAEQQAQVAQQQAQDATQQLKQQQSQQGALITVNGRVAATQDNALLLRSPAGESVRLFVNDDTQVLINGQRAAITDLTQGTEVRASYRNLGEKEPLALRVEVMNQATGGSGADNQPQQQGSEPKD